jgi:hypothetical protein
MMRVKTWHVEGLAVAASLSSAVLLLGKAGDWREWLAALGVQLGFHHASVANRLQEAQEMLQKHSGALDSMPMTRAHHVECVRWLSRYWVAKELAWVAYFLATGAVSPLVGCVVFLLHPLWRRWYRSRSGGGGR